MFGIGGLPAFMRAHVGRLVLAAPIVARRAVLRNRDQAKLYGIAGPGMVYARNLLVGNLVAGVRVFDGAAGIGHSLQPRGHVLHPGHFALARFCGQPVGALRAAAQHQRGSRQRNDAQQSHASSPPNRLSAAYCNRTTVFASQIRPSAAMAMASAKGSSSTSMSSPSSLSPPPGPGRSRESYSATNRCSRSVTAPGLMNNSNTLRIFFGR